MSMGRFFIKHGILIVAVIALVQPWLLAAFRRFCRRGTVDIFPTGSITIGYTVFGPTVQLNGTLRAIHQDLFVSSIALEIVREKDGSKHIFHWGFFTPQRLTYKGVEGEFELPYGFVVETLRPKRYSICFFDTSTQHEMQPIIRQVQKKWTQAISEKMQAGIPPDDESVREKYYGDFIRNRVYGDAFTKLDRLCYWQSGSYLLSVQVLTSKPDRMFTKEWKFHLTEDETKTIGFNVIKILADTCMQSSPGQYFFAFPLYERS